MTAGEMGRKPWHRWGWRMKSGIDAFLGTAPEKRKLTLGFIPLTDCALLAVAKEGDFFLRHGLDVTLSREASWANIRDKVAAGVLDAAQMLAPMPIASSLGLGVAKVPMLTALTLDLNGNAITASHRLYEEMISLCPGAAVERPMTAKGLRAVVDNRKKNHGEKLRFAMVAPFSTHNYALRYWLAAADIHPDRDVQLLVIPPPYMVDNLEAGNIDGYCVGEPWNSLAVHHGIGRTLITSYEIWNNSQEKVLGVTQRWADKHPVTHRRLLVALLEAAEWLDENDHRLQAAELISHKQYVDAPLDVVKMPMLGTFKYASDEAARPIRDFNVFFRYAATFPWRSHAIWFITQMIRWGQLRGAVDFDEVAARVYRSDIYASAAAALDINAPVVDSKCEGVNAEPWTVSGTKRDLTLGPSLFFDGGRFQPERAWDYVRQFPTHSMTLELVKPKRPLGAEF